MSHEKAAAFNAFTADWKNRIETLLNTIVLLSGGVMSISIGAYINGKPPVISTKGITIIKLSWYLLSASLVSAVLVYFLLVISGAIVIKQWEKRIKLDPQGLVIIDSPLWLYLLSWIFGVIAVFSCITGVALMAHGASFLMNVSALTKALT